jgi:hypothetical protein
MPKTYFPFIYLFFFTGLFIDLGKREYVPVTRANNVSQSARLFTFCVLDQSECQKFETYKQKELCKRSEKITPCSTPSVPFDIKLFTPKLTNSDKACFLLQFPRGDFLNSI